MISDTLKNKNQNFTQSRAVLWSGVHERYVTIRQGHTLGGMPTGRDEADRRDVTGSLRVRGARTPSFVTFVFVYGTSDCGWGLKGRGGKEGGAVGSGFF